VDDKEAYLNELIEPKSSHMDFNIACALYFASRGEGYLVEESYFESEEFLAMRDAIEGVKGAKREGPGREEEVKRGNKKAKSFDYGMVTQSV
jgi:hypothetical protein